MRPALRAIVLASALSLTGAFAEARAQTTFFAEDKRWVLTGAPLAGTNSAGARASFLSGLSGVGTESFESFAVGSETPLDLSFSGAGVAKLTNNGVVSNNAGSAGRKATSGSKYWDLSTGNSGEQFTINSRR